LEGENHENSNGWIERDGWVNRDPLLDGTKDLARLRYLASLVWMGTDILASLRYEGYNYPFQPISGLSAVGAPTRSFLIPLDNLYRYAEDRLRHRGFGCPPANQRALRITAGLLFASGVVDLAAYFFPWNPSEALLTLTNIMHGILAGGGTVFDLLTIGFGARADGKWFRFYSYGTLLVFIVSGSVMAILGIPGLRPTSLRRGSVYGAHRRLRFHAVDAGVGCHPLAHPTRLET
jgi:hypothetical protein